jgi:hypothetical protein
MTSLQLSRCDNCGLTVKDDTGWLLLTLKRRGTRDAVYRDWHARVDLCSLNCARGYVEKHAEDDMRRVAAR